jgi:hypothetical protein
LGVSASLSPIIFLAAKPFQGQNGMFHHDVHIPGLQKIPLRMIHHMKTLNQVFYLKVSRNIFQLLGKIHIDKKFRRAAQLREKQIPVP